MCMHIHVCVCVMFCKKDKIFYIGNKPNDDRLVIFKDYLSPETYRFPCRPFLPFTRDFQKTNEQKQRKRKNKGKNKNLGRDH